MHSSHCNVKNKLPTGWTCSSSQIKFMTVVHSMESPGLFKPYVKHKKKKTFFRVSQLHQGIGSQIPTLDHMTAARKGKLFTSPQRTILFQKFEKTHTRKMTGYFVLPESSILGGRISLTFNSGVNSHQIPKKPVQDQKHTITIIDKDTMRDCGCLILSCNIL